MGLLDTIEGPLDLKALDKKLLPELAQEIRKKLLQITSQNGGHIGPNLGVVELTIVLHRLFNFLEDKIVFDVGHQAYVHKLLTGRKEAKFEKLRQTGGYSGFTLREESPYDHFGAGHAGTALSAALGMATARDKRGSHEHVIAFIGDATLTCGIAMEALNNIATSTKRLIVILNDNEWSISKNVGAIAKYLNELITSPAYNKFHKYVGRFLKKFPGGKTFMRLISRAKKETKDLFVPSSLFEKYGLRYIGPIDGHNFDELTHYLQFCKDFNKPILLHVSTKKGKGYEVALKNPEKFHGTGTFEMATGESKSKSSTPAYQDIVGKALTRFAKADKKIIGITAAMPSGTGLSVLQKELPDQFFDIGIAEEHAVIFAAGLATQGFKPVVAIYSTFLQRGYDPIIHDVCLQNLPVLFCMDRAGLSPNDGPTHHGLFDIAYLRCVPNVVLAQPKDEDELVDLMHTGLQHQGPFFIRYPRGAAQGVPIKSNPVQLPIGKAEEILSGKDIIIWALGPMVEEAYAIALELRKQHRIDVGVVNARFAKPIDTELLFAQATFAKLFVIMEDGVLKGGFGSAVLEALQDKNILKPVKRIGWPDNFIPHGSSVNELRAQYGLSKEQMMADILEGWREVVTVSNHSIAVDSAHSQ